MTFRNLDGNHDWIWGTGKNSYVSETQEIALNIKTRLLSFLGDCFFATDAGIDYWNLLTRNRQEELENQIQTTIVETPGVERINSIDIILGANRKFNITYSITTVYGTTLENAIPLNIV